MRQLWLLLYLAMMAFGSATAQTQAAPLKTNGDVWWKHAVIYEIYPRSFQDSNGDGLGDIKGITQRLSYLKSLGIDAIWITPMYPSPQVDFGYDIADYEAIDPQYGTMGDFDNLMKAAKQQGIRVIMDMVMNHTSDQNPWFMESRSSKTNPKRDWYIWRDGKDGGPPNNWQSWFGHSAWTLDPKTGQYYYHYFYVQQPDLNWRNPEVRKAMYDVMRFWLDKGVAGFRIDAVSRLFEDPNLHDDPILPGKNAFGDPNIEHKYTDNLPEVHDVLKELRKLVDSYPGNPVLISEADEPNIVELSKMYGTNNDEVQLPMDFQIADVNELSATKFRKLFDEVENNPAHGWPEYFFSNHDQARQWDRYGDGKHNDEIAKLMAALVLLPRATPQMYYGEEIGHAHYGAHPDGGCARSRRRDRVAEGQGPRRRAHTDAVDAGAAECRLHVADGEAVAAGSAEFRDVQHRGRVEGSGLDPELLQATAGAAADGAGAEERRLRHDQSGRSECLFVPAALPGEWALGAGGAEHERQAADGDLRPDGPGGAERHRADAAEQLRLRAEDDTDGPHDDPAVRDSGHRGKVTVRYLPPLPLRYGRLACNPFCCYEVRWSSEG